MTETLKTLSMPIFCPDFKGLSLIHSSKQVVGRKPRTGASKAHVKGKRSLRSGEKIPLPIQRFTDEAKRLFSVMEKLLAAVPSW
jgi:hypothetical protein